MWETCIRSGVNALQNEGVLRLRDGKGIICNKNKRWFADGGDRMGPAMTEGTRHSLKIKKHKRAAWVSTK